MSGARRRVGLLAALAVLCAPLSAWPAVTPDLQAATPSTGTIVTVRFPAGACAQQRMSAVVTVTDRQRRPLARVRVVLRGGTSIAPAYGVTAATGRVTLLYRPVPYRRGPLVVTAIATPTDRPGATKQLALPSC